MQQPPPLSLPPDQEAAVAEATMTKENVSINQAVCETIENLNPSLNNNILTTVCNSGRNLAGADTSELHALGLEVENVKPLPKNLPNVSTMNCSSSPFECF